MEGNAYEPYQTFRIWNRQKTEKKIEVEIHKGVTIGPRFEEEACWSRKQSSSVLWAEGTARANALCRRGARSVSGSQGRGIGSSEESRIYFPNSRIGKRQGWDN